MEQPKKKILFILPALGSGGAERVLITILNNIDTTKFSPEFLAFNEDGAARAWIASDVPFHSFGHKPVRSSILPLIRFVRQHKPDVVFTTMVHANAAICLLKIFYPKVKVVIRESSVPSALLTEYGRKGRLCHFVYRFLYPLADCLISPAQMIVDEFRDDLKIGGIKHRVIYNPVDTSRIYPLIPATFPVDGVRGVRFVFLGRLAREKGLDLLINALAHAHFPHGWRLDLIGDGDQREKLEKLIIERKLQDHIFIRGHDTQPWNIAARADALLLPSLWEGMPNVALEALACGVPVIALRSAGAISEIATAAPDHVRILNTQGEMVAAMQEVMPQHKKSLAPSRLPECFMLHHVVKAYEAVF